jgi:NADPH:quinone reductase-like Zn-dependent oxidoreductase
MSTLCLAIHHHGFDGLQPVRRTLPEPGPREVRLRMRAMSVNYRDLQVVLGTYHTRFELPLVPLSDGVGEVEVVGEAVTRVKPGQRVMLAFWAARATACSPSRSSRRRIAWCPCPTS